MSVDRIERIDFSATMRICSLARKMRAAGIDIIDLSVGEPDFPTPENIKAAAKRAIDNNITKYTPNDGLPELKQAIIQRFQADQHLDYTPEEIIISSGAKNCLYNVCQVVLDTGLEAIIPAPYWVSYPAMVALARGTPVLVPTYEADGFRLTPAALQAAITPNTRALILNNPCNPTGAFYQRDHLEPLLEIARAAKLIIIADEVYEKLTYDGLKFVSVAALSAEARPQCVVISGVSKSYAMTGWRIGYAAGPAALITAMNKVQSHSTSNASSISQMATIEALLGSQHSVARMVAEFQSRRDYLAHRLRQIPGITCHQSQGAFYLFPNFSAYLDREFEGHRLRNSYDLTNYLLEQARVAVVPGAAFGGENYIRFAYAAARADLETAMDRITQALLQLR